MIIDGQKIASNLLDGLKQKIESFKQKPGLAFILVGEHKPSLSYVKMKSARCKQIGMHSEIISLPENAPLSELLQTIHNLNQNDQIDGILVQQPLPKHLDIHQVNLAIDPKKDVDGFHPENIGKLCSGDESGFIPCTPYGILKLLQSCSIKLEGKHTVIIGRSNIVGRPLANLLSQKPFNSTVTLAHSKTLDLPGFSQSADILISAMGKPLFINDTFVKKGAVVIDVGITKTFDGKLVGDVDFEKVSKIASYITPVPGGVGPMTIAMLLSNTTLSYTRRCLS